MTNVELVNKIEYRSESKVSLEDFMGGDDRVCMSAWTSFGNDDAERLEDRKRVEGLINFLYREKHMTPFESSAFTFRISTPIFVAREFFRHRTGKFNEWSGRYSKMEPAFYLPAKERPIVQEGKAGAYTFVDGTYGQYAMLLQAQKHSFETAWNTYEMMLNEGVAKEVARNVLPLSTYTYFYATFDARNLMHFLNLRQSPQALYEIREVANKMAEHLKDKMPLTYAAFEKYGI